MSHKKVGETFTELLRKNIFPGETENFLCETLTQVEPPETALRQFRLSVISKIRNSVTPSVLPGAARRARWP